MKRPTNHDASAATIRLILSIFMLALCIQTSLGEDEEAPFRQFTNRAGKTIEARIVQVVKGKTVVLEMKSGKKIPLPMSKLSEKDQLYVYGWAEEKKNDGEDPGSDDGGPDATGIPDADMTESPVFTFDKLGNVREKKTDHFHIIQISRTAAPASRYAEKAWDQCNEVMPDLTQSFEQKGFKDPSRSSNGTDFKHEGEKFLFRAYMVDDDYVWENMTVEHGDRLGSDANKESFLKLVAQTRIFNDFQNRFIAMNNNSKYRQGDAAEGLFVHSLSSTLLRGQAQCSKLPLWMGAGIGWNIEHRIFNKCRVSYLDYEKFYNEQEGKIKRSEIFKVDYSWVAPTKALLKDGAVSTIPQILGASVGHLTPESSGCIFAFTAFLISDEMKIAAYKKFIKSLRSGDAKPSPGANEVAKAFGYADKDEMEQAFRAFLKSRHFK